MAALEGVVAINDPQWPNPLLVDEQRLGDIVNFLNSNKEAINSEWGYEYVKNHCKAIIAKEEEGHKSNIQMMPYNDLLIKENDEKNRAYSCCLECSLGFIDYSKQPDNNYKYILVYQDDVTKFTILKPLQEKSREEISHCLLEIFSLFGVPAKIYTCEKSIVKSVFNKNFRNFCQNFSTKIKQIKKATFEETECCRIDREIKKWMESTMSKKWSQGLYFIQFQNNCYFNQVINAAPFHALLKPNYTYSRRKYTRYLFRNGNDDERLNRFFLNHPVCISNQEKERTTFHKSSGEEMNEKGFSSLKEVDDMTNILNNNHLESEGCSKILRNECGVETHSSSRTQLLENEYQPQIRSDVCEQKISEPEREIKQLHEHKKDYEKMCVVNSINKDEFFPLKNECKPISENNLLNSSTREFSIEKIKTEFEQKFSLPEEIHEFVNALENDCFENPQPEKCFKNESNQENSLIKYLGNNSATVRSDEVIKNNNIRKCSSGNDQLDISKNIRYHVLRLEDSQEKNISTAKLRHNDSHFEVGIDLNKKIDIYNFKNASPMNNNKKVSLRNENSKIYLKLTDDNPSNLDGNECVHNNHLNIGENNLTSQKPNLKINSVRFAHDCRGKQQVCLICNKKKKHKASNNSFSNNRFAIGATVRVRVPVIDRLKGYPNYILATIIEEKDRMYKVATPKGVLKEMFKRDQLCLCNTAMLDTVGHPTLKTKTSKALKYQFAAPSNKKLDKKPLKKDNVFF